MNDQAESLRRIVSHSGGPGAKVVAVVSGKGGVGKSNVCLNFALSLIKLDKKVAIIDLDIGMGNLDILMGMQSKRTIVDLLKSEWTIWDIIEKGPEDLSYLAGGSGFSELIELKTEDMERFLTQLNALETEYDYIFLDMGAGVTKEGLKFILAAHEVMVVTTPEPTAMTDAYAMIKYIYLQDETKEIMVIVNRCETSREGEQTASNFKRVTKEFLRKEISVLGSLPDDRSVSRAVKAQKPFVHFDKKSNISKAMREMVLRYTGTKRPKPSYSFSQLIRGLKRKIVD
ncbi:MinD/ParA family protein [Alkalihalophilus pseudofirmus]|uniref:MinD/ParA family protein n=1 Tax=Alkalihalophilus pseudofirmus TaxID=79885 RepID=UPI00259B6970|nr:MinD/ParA family protein [Alkalihalophilus pseudofirmus]WEG15602.1 MinD/ParA family protein [Alkalihalophilus pseudofirmus]